MVLQAGREVWLLPVWAVSKGGMLIDLGELLEDSDSAMRHSGSSAWKSLDTQGGWAFWEVRVMCADV